MYYIYDGDNVVGFYDENGNLESRYVTPGLDENLSMTRGQDTYYYMRDGLGSVRNVVGASETVENIYDYRAFGLMITEIEGVECPCRFTAREREPGGLSQAHFYRNRYYMPGVGLFMSRDAMWADVHMGWGYVANSPTFYVDPYGWSLWLPEGGNVNLEWERDTHDRRQRIRKAPAADICPMGWLHSTTSYQLDRANTWQKTQEWTDECGRECRQTVTYIPVYKITRWESGTRTGRRLTRAGGVMMGTGAAAIGAGWLLTKTVVGAPAGGPLMGAGVITGGAGGVTSIGGGAINWVADRWRCPRPDVNEVREFDRYEKSYGPVQCEASE